MKLSLNNNLKMKNEILQNSNNPEQLEKLYRDNKLEFQNALAEIPEDDNRDLIMFWKLRLTPEITSNAKVFSKTDLWVLVLLSLVTGFFAKIPAILNLIVEDFFYQRNLAVIVFNGIILYTFWQNRFFDKKKLMVYGLSVLIIVLYMNLLPDIESDSIILSMIHTPLLLWCIFGLAFVSFDFNDNGKRIKFISFNGEFITMTGLIFIAGGLFTAITIGLFSVIEMDIEKFYFEYIAIFGGVAAPIVSIYLIRLYPNLTNKIAPVIARVFTPIVLVTLAIYIVSLVFSSTKILEDRDLLILFNVMLLAVLAIIVFSVSELEKSKKKDFNVLILLLLALLAIVINSIALIAIISRVANGLTPNRTVVMASNILIFFNLILILKDLYMAYFKNKDLESIEQTVAKYLSVYTIYTLIVIFVMPFAFGFR
jgi:hypothetical protein